MITTPTAAASAYSMTQQIAGQGAGQATGGLMPDVAGTGGQGFAQALQQAVTDTTAGAAQADRAAAAMLEGQGDMVGLVTAVAESEVAVQTLVSVRDRVISAYEEIMRMPI